MIEHEIICTDGVKLGCYFADNLEGPQVGQTFTVRSFKNSEEKTYRVISWFVDDNKKQVTIQVERCGTC